MPLAVLALGAAAGVSLRSSRPPPPSSEIGLRSLPLSVGRFQGRELPADDSVFAYLGADEMIDRVYVDQDAEQAAKVSVVFARGWRALHSPRACFTNQGWSVIEDRPVDIPVPAEPHEAVHGNLLVMSKQGSRMVTVYTFAAGTATTGDWLLHSLRMAVGRGPAGGALIVAVAAAADAGQDDAAAEAATVLVGSLYASLVKLLGEEGDVGLAGEG